MLLQLTWLRSRFPIEGSQKLKGHDEVDLTGEFEIIVLLKEI